MGSTKTAFPWSDACGLLWRSGAACRSHGWRCAAEALFAFLALAWTTGHAFRQPPGADLHTYFLIPPLLWVILRFGPRGAVLGALTVCAISAWHTVQGTGPFAAGGGGVAGHLTGLAGFLGVTMLSALTLAVVTEKLREAREEAFTQKKRVDALLEAEESTNRTRKMEALSRLASRTAHDFNNALTAILGYCDLVLSDMPADDERHADIRAIERAALNAARVSERLTVFSRHHMNNARPVDLNALIQQMDGDLAAMLTAQIARVYRLEPGLPLVRLDPSQFKEILRQLTANAREAMPGGGRLVIATQRRAGLGIDGRAVADGGVVRVTVHDEGPGLSDEARAHLFEPYFSTRSKEKDKGLGLAVCYGLMRQNDGQISFHSAPGKGTAFHLDFPAWTGAPAATPAAPNGEDTQRSPRGVETILLAEDEEDVRTAMARVLAGLGYTVLTAEDGRDALRRLDQDKEGRIRLLLSDVVMPGMNGVDLAKEVHARRPDVKRLLMSGYAERSLLAEGTLPLGTAFLQKPFTYAALARRIRDILDLSSSTDLLK